VTNDALGNVTDSINYMLDNFTKFSSASASGHGSDRLLQHILVAADEMQAGATQQDQEITNTSSAVEELTVSMKQVSNNAEASAEAARRALDAAEQGNRASATRLRACSESAHRCRRPPRKSNLSATAHWKFRKIINVINDIRNKTNLLALNAGHRGSTRGRGGPRLCGRRRRSPQACRTQPQRDERYRSADQGNSGGDERSGRGHGRRHEGSGEWRNSCRSGRPRAGRHFQRVRQSAELVQEISLAVETAGARTEE